MGSTPLSELAALFLKLGTTAFGGPAAHIAMMHDEVVVRRQWLTHAEFADLLGATNLIPGPNSTEMAIHIGHRRAGFPGLLVAGACFIVPAALLVTACAWAYVRYGSLPRAGGILYGVKPVIVAIVLKALWDLSRTVLKSAPAILVGAGSIVLAAAGVNELTILAVAAGSAAGWYGIGRRGVLLAAPFGLLPLFLFFLKVGSVLYGSGYVLLAFLRSGLVERYGWLSEAQLLDAVAVGQFTPGPVFTTATFIGYVLGGWMGAVVATLGIFVPAFFFVAISGPIVPKIRRSPLAAAVLDGVNAASLALMGVVTFLLGRSALIDLPALAMTAISLAILLRYRVNSAWLVLGGALAGAAAQLLR